MLGYDHLPVTRIMTSANLPSAESNRFDYAIKVFEKAADYREQLEKFIRDNTASDEESHRYAQQQAEYYVLRTCLVIPIPPGLMALLTGDTGMERR